jgi:hypothetical protein
LLRKGGIFATLGRRGFEFLFLPPVKPGSLVYKTFGVIHQWGNPGSEPLTFLAFNINPEGVPAIAALSVKRAPDFEEHRLSSIL